MKFLLLALALGSSFCAQASTLNGEELPKGFDLKAAIAGEYKNSRGDNATVKVTVEGDQPDLFKDEQYAVHFEFATKNGNEGTWLTENDFVGIDAEGNLEFSREEECEDPGCTSGVYNFQFKKKKDGTYYLTGDASFSSDENESILEWWEGDLNDLTEKDAQKYCVEQYGEKAIGHYDGSNVNCEYERIYQLKKVK